MSDKIISLHNGRIIIIEPEDKESIVPLFCPLCEFPIKTIEDTISYKIKKCCNRCENRWTKTIFGNWDEGWRPDKDSEEWKEYIYERNLLSRPVFNFK